ncbi:uncharacterized protein [Dysidea avara]|uniref:uncharacterized protein n=1 Tax=Dysidea avara TaxID=196820 RepID=UPI00332ACF3C
MILISHIYFGDGHCVSVSHDLMHAASTLTPPVGTSLLIVVTLTVRDVLGSSRILQGLSELFTVHKLVPYLNTEGVQAFINAKKMRQPGGGLALIPSGVEILLRGLLYVLECVCTRSSLHSCTTLDHIETSQQTLLDCAC